MITVAVSCYNEEKDLRHTVMKLFKAASLAGNPPLDVIIVNDGSTDRSAQVIAELEKEFPAVRSIHYPENRGIGTGLKDALKIAKYEYFCNFPGDNACSLSIMQNLFANVGKADFLISYIVNTEDRGFGRQVTSAAYSFIYLITFQLPIRYVNGSPMYRTSLLRQTPLRSGRYSILAECAVKMLRRNITFMEIPDFIYPMPSNTSALRWHNVREVIKTYIRLVHEIFFSKKDEYRYRARRVKPLIEFD